MHFRLSNGLSMAYHVRGAGRIVMFLHPIGTRAAFWDGVVERIAGRYRCITVDLRGHGDSDVPRQSFSLDDLADDVIELLRFERARDAVVVGCSLGGMVTQGVALKAPDLLGGIVLADTGYKQTPEGRKAVQQRADDFYTACRRCSSQRSRGGSRRVSWPSIRPRCRLVVPGFWTMTR